MLLLNRRVNESITTWKHGEKDDPLVIRVTEVSPAGTVTLGFEGAMEPSLGINEAEKRLCYGVGQAIGTPAGLPNPTV